MIERVQEGWRKPPASRSAIGSAGRPSRSWYKDAIIYQLHVRTFCDSNNDGIGDFPGLTQKLDYLQDLGIDALWLMPFFPSPLRDDGYDIADYNSVHPNYGKLEDFKAFLNAAHARGIRVIIELVLNHTSDQHLVSGSAQLPRQSQARLVCVERYRRSLQGRAHHLSRYGAFQLGLGPGFEILLLAPLFQPPARSELRQSRRLRSHVGRDEILAGHWRGRIPAGRGSLSGRARRHQLRKPAGNARHHPRTSQAAGRRISRTKCFWPKPISGPPTCRSILATATNSTWPFIFR